MKNYLLLIISIVLILSLCSCNLPPKTTLQPSRSELPPPAEYREYMNAEYYTTSYDTYKETFKGLKNGAEISCFDMFPQKLITDYAMAMDYVELDTFEYPDAPEFEGKPDGIVSDHFLIRFCFAETCDGNYKESGHSSVEYYVFNNRYKDPFQYNIEKFVVLDYDYPTKIYYYADAGDYRFRINDRNYCRIRIDPTLIEDESIVHYLIKHTFEVYGIE